MMIRKRKCDYNGMEDPSMDRAFGGWKNFVLFLERASWFFFFLRS
jgi:hypothetical protein